MKFSKVTKSLIVVMPLILAACGKQVDFKANNASSSTGKLDPDTPAAKDDVPYCEINIGQLDLDGNVNAFEFTGGGGVSVGYNSQGTHNAWGVQGSVHVDVFSMDVSLNGREPMTGNVLASTDVSSNQNKINTDVDFTSMVTVGAQFYFDTPLAKVSAAALTKGVLALKSQMDRIEWKGRVLKRTSDNRLVLNAGSLVGVKPGDEFYIYNVKHDWANDSLPCNSNYFGSRRVPSTPVAVVKVEAVDTAISYLTFEGDEKAHVKLGAEVVVKSFVDPTDKTRYLKKKAFVNHITANNITLPGGINFDLGAAMDSQVIKILSDGGFVYDVK